MARYPAQRLVIAAALAAAGGWTVPTLCAEPVTEPTAIVYLTREDAAEGTRGSLSEPVVADYGWQGAQFGVEEINVNGRFLGKHYQLSKVSVPARAEVAQAGRQLLADGYRLIIADLSAADLLALAALPEASGALILDARASDDTLRQADCRSNVFHLLPNWAMRADALGQYLAHKGWKRWFVLTGAATADQAYATAVRRAATRVGAKIVLQRAFQRPGGITEQTHSPVPYDILMVLDTEDRFGDTALFNTWDPRLVAGTHGLTALAWHPLFKEYAARGIQYRFFLAASREMTERDYGSWLAASIIGEAVTRSGKSDPASLTAYLLSDQFSIPANKGEGLSFRSWDHQLRQPLLLFGPRFLVSMWPQDAGHGGKLLTDSMGFDRSESECRMGEHHGN